MNHRCEFTVVPIRSKRTPRYSVRRSITDREVGTIACTGSGWIYRASGQNYTGIVYKSRRGAVSALLEAI